MKIHATLVHVFPEALEYARMGLIPGGAYRNREFRTRMVDIQQGISDELVITLFDPQTSGGLLIVLPGDDAGKLVLQLREGGVEEAAIIGEIIDTHPGTIVVEE